MKTIKIKIQDIRYSYKNLTGDLGAKSFIDELLRNAEFNMSLPYKKYVDETNTFLIFEQE